jgi:hypothetical protein
VSWQALTAAVVCLAIGGCSREPSNESQNVSYPTRDPGSAAVPTTDASFRLLSAEGPTRFAALQGLVLEAGKPCSVVTAGILKGGLDGTDEWRVTCNDGGVWSVWLHSDAPPEVLKCAGTRCS